MTTKEGAADKRGFCARGADGSSIGFCSLLYVNSGLNSSSESRLNISNKLVHLPTGRLSAYTDQQNLIFPPTQIPTPYIKRIKAKLCL